MSELYHDDHCDYSYFCSLIRIESRLAEKQQWLDSEVESLLQERTAVEVLQQVEKIVLQYMSYMCLR